MPMKEILHRFQPFQLYLVLVLTCLYFLIQLILSQSTHSITLLVSCYQSLCNIIALAGCLLTLKHGGETSTRIQKNSSTCSLTGENSMIESTVEKQQVELIDKRSKHRQSQLKNTFGWTRIDVLTMLIVCIFLASLCFSVLVESFQTLIHIDHQDTMHLPLPVLIVGTLGILLNGLSYLLIGGYSFRQTSFIHLTPKGDVILDNVIATEGIKKGNSGSNESIQSNHSKKSKDLSVPEKRKRQNIHDICRDLCSCIFVIICASIIFIMDENDTSKLIDPIISIFSCVVLLFLSYPYMKQSGLILLQTIPDTIDIEFFKSKLLENFKEIENIHDLHIWQLTSDKYVSTAHIIFKNEKVYIGIFPELLNYFQDQGINHVTIQPEFSSTTPVSAINENSPCLFKCPHGLCQPKNCCIDEHSQTKDLKQIRIENHLQDLSVEKNLDESETCEIILNSNTLANSTSFKSLCLAENEPRISTKKSTVSLNLPSTVGSRKYQKAVSAIESVYHPETSCTKNSNTKSHYISDSIINNEHDQQNKKEIVIENRLVEQLDHIDNNEMENLYNRCKESAE